MTACKPETTPDDASVALGIRAAVASLNRLIDHAQSVGIQVSFGVSTWTGLRPHKSHVEVVRIERPSDWTRDYSGEVL